MNLVHVEQPRLTVGELKRKIEEKPNPVRRSTHIGNQPAHELLLMHAMPKGIDIVMVDTIQGNDSYAMPKMVVLPGESSLPLCRRKQAVGRVVSSISVDTGCLPGRLDLACEPIDGESLADFHTRAINALEPTNRPLPMMKFFGSHGDLLSATMTACHRLGKLNRRVLENGTIVAEDTTDPQETGVFGVDDVTPSTEGAMLPLNGMMALEMSISGMVLGADKTTHLAGPHMADYTRDEARMNDVGLIMAKTASELGVQAMRQCYEVVDITGLSRIVTPETHISQHQLLRTGAERVCLDDFVTLPCA